MTELQSLMAQRDELLGKIRVIEETYEGIENENNAAKIQKCNLEKLQLIEKKESCLSKLSTIELRLNALDSEIDSLTSTGMNKILDAIQKQRWFFFKNKPNILLDKFTGLLWIRLDNFDWSYSSFDPSRYKGKVFDGFKCWLIPQYDDLKLFIDSKPPLNCNDLIWGNNWFCENNGNIVNNHGGNDGRLIICNDSCIRGTEYKAYANPSNNSYNTKEKSQLTLHLFVNNNLVPVFTNRETTDIYEQIYVRKPRLLEELVPVQKQISALQEVTLLSSEFDYTALLSKYDTKAADNSIIKYYQTIQKWCDELLDKLDYYEQEMEGIIRDFNLISLKLSKKYEDNPNLNKTENELLANRQRYFQNKFSLGMHSVKSKILAVKKQADDLEYRIDEIDNGDDAIRALALLEKEERASFEFIAENTAKIIKNALLKVEYFQDNHQFVMSAIAIWEKWSEDYRIFKTTYREDLKAQCEDDGIEEEVWTKWYEDWQKLRFAIEQKVQPIIERGLRTEMPTVEKTEISIPELLISVLGKYKEGVDVFFKEERKGIYQKFVFQAGGDLQEKFESEGELYKCTASFQNALQEIVFNCASAEDRIFILKWANSLLDIQIDEVLAFVADNDLQKISNEVLREFATLKQKNYDTYLADAKTYSAEKQRREKEYNSLIFKMRKELMKR